MDQPPSSADGLTYEQVTSGLRRAYDENALERETKPKAAWMLEQRARFLELLREQGARTLLEIGSGTGQDARFFEDRGIRVTCTDLSPKMVEFCRAKGLEAHVMDALNLSFRPASFDAAYSVNCLLHVPTTHLPAVLGVIRDVIVPGGLFYLGMYGGVDKQEIYEQPGREPRFFANRSDDTIRRMVGSIFELVSFEPIQVPDDPIHFQAMVLRRA